MTVYVVSGLAVCDGKVLMGLRPPNKLRPSMWEYPGGKVEPREDFQDALVREWREELGIEISVSGLIDAVRLDVDATWHISLYRIRLPSDFTLQPLEHVELRWVDPLDAIKHLPCTPSTYLVYQQVVEHIRKHP